MTPPRLIVGHGNGHNRISLVTWVREVLDAGAASVGVNEAQKLGHELNGLPDSRVIGYTEGWDEPGNRGNSSAIVTSSDYPSRGRLESQVSERIPSAEKLAPDRILHASFFEHPLARAVGADYVAHWELHPDATVMRHGQDHPIVREYREALESARRWMAAAKRDGALNVLTGDLQATEEWRSPLSPRKLLAEPLSMRFRVAKIDWIMCDSRLRFDGPLERAELFDHTAFTVAMVPARSTT